MSSQRYFSDTLKQKKKKIQVIKLSIWFFVFVILLVGVVFFVRMSYIQISNVKITGNTFISTQEIQTKTDSILNSSILGFIPKRNILIFSKRELELEIKKNPAVISVKIKKDFFDTIHISIVEQEKEMVYCTWTDHTHCFYINKTGFIYAKITDFIIPEQEVIMYTEQATKNIQDTIAEEELYLNIVTFIKSVTRYELKVGQAHIKSDGTVEFVTRDGVRIITSIYDDFEKDFANLVALFEKEVLTKEQLSTIEYIDLRFGNKVFYKNKTN